MKIPPFKEKYSKKINFRLSSSNKKINHKCKARINNINNKMKHNNSHQISSNFGYKLVNQVSYMKIITSNNKINNSSKKY